MKKVALIFWTIVGGIVLALAMTIYTAINEKKASDAQPQSIPTPAVLPR